MLNDRKIRLMTKLALYERKEGKEDIKLSKYYRTDYVRLQVLKTVVAVTFSYILILLLIAIYKLEYLIDQAVVLDYAGIGKMILGIYIVVLTAFVLAVLVGYSIKYRKSRKKLSKYFRMLKRLKHIYNVEDGLIEEDEEETGVKEDTTV